MFVCNNGFSQDYKPTSQSNYNLDFNTYLSGVKYAYVGISDDAVEFITNNPMSANSQAISGIIDYLKSIGFEYVSWGSFSNQPQNLSSLCDLVLVNPSWDVVYSSFTNIKLTFVSCNQDVFQFESSKNIGVTGFTVISSAFYNKCSKMYGYKKNYLINQRLKLPSELTNWDEAKLKDHFLQNGVDGIEGIYESAIATASMPKYQIGVIKYLDGYSLIYLSGATNYEDWQEGEVKGKLIATATPNLFKTKWKMGNKSENDNAYISFDPGLMNLVMQDKDKTTYIKLYPTANDNVSINNFGPSSGTGFGISSNGLIVTNSHVVNGSSKITVRGINGDFSKSYSAKVITEDKNNDLAIIQINDPSFISLGNIPYTIANKGSDVGASVFALGYPLKTVMGDEIKLTNGIISSKSGFKGDVTSYQISVPLQPGNSGGPLFDFNGDLIGIVNAKLTIGENVSYAVKASYLRNLIELLPITPKLQTVNLIAGKNLTDQVKIINKYVYLVEVN
jgi:hypothetical protein